MDQTCSHRANLTLSPFQKERQQKLHLPAIRGEMAKSRAKRKTRRYVLKPDPEPSPAQIGADR